VTTETALGGVAALLFIHAAVERWRLKRRIKRLEHCAFSISWLNGKPDLMRCPVH
jgi:hypothetical protein